MTPEQASSMATSATPSNNNNNQNINNNTINNNTTISVAAAAAATSTPDRQYNLQKRGRPPFNTQQSSSVPSTPLQHPRDVRFSSRSPSPSKTLGANSPQSVASEAVGTAPPPRLVQPSVCKFEIGAEIKKRRVIYTEGGNEPLPPPTVEPKKALEPHEDEKLTGDMRELYNRLLPTDESEERRVKLVQKLENILNTEWPGNDIKVNVFGSSGNLLSSTDSDGALRKSLPSFVLTEAQSSVLTYDSAVDVCVTTSEKKLESMHNLATVLHRRMFLPVHMAILSFSMQCANTSQMVWKRWSAVPLRRCRS